MNRPSPAERTATRRGFTFVEAIVVAAIFAFMLLVILSMFSGKSEQARDLMARKDRQQSARLLFSHLLLDIKGAMGFSQIEEGRLKLYYFRNVPSASLDFTDNLLDGKTSSTQTILYEWSEGVVHRSVDGKVMGSYAGIDRALFVPLTLDPDSASTAPIKGDRADSAVGVYIELAGGDEEDAEFKQLQLKTKIFSETLWCLRIYGNSDRGRPYYPDRGGFFSPLDRCRVF